MSRFELDLDRLPAPYSLTVTDNRGRLDVLIGLRSAEDALVYAEHYGVPIESDDEHPLRGCVMRSVSAAKVEPGLTLFLAGSSVVDAETVGAR